MKFKNNILLRKGKKGRERICNKKNPCESYAQLPCAAQRFVTFVVEEYHLTPTNPQKPFKYN